MKRNTGFHFTVTKFSDYRWCIRRGKSTWYFTLPAEKPEFDKQIQELTDYAHRIQNAEKTPVVEIIKALRAM